MGRDPIGYEDGNSMYHYVRNRGLKLIDPSGLAGKPVCVRETNSIGKWRLIDVGASGTVSFPSPSPSATISEVEEQVTELTCMYERVTSARFRCMPCAWNPAKVHPNNTCNISCKDIGTATTSPNTANPIFVGGVAISWAPSWWPNGVPGPSITVFQNFKSPADRSLAVRACQSVGVANISALSNSIPASFTVPSNFPGCSINCP